MTKTYTAYIAVRIAVEADSANEAKGEAGLMRAGLAANLPTGASIQNWLDDFRLASTPQFTS